jgi:hypothetical protein
MANIKISDLPELTTGQAVDVLPVVDIATSATKKIKLQNLPISSAVQSSLNAISDSIPESTTDVFTLSSLDISQKKVTLSKTPISSDSVKFIPDGGIEQRINIDYVLNANEILWDSLTLDGFLEEGEIVRITYLA